MARFFNSILVVCVLVASLPLWVTLYKVKSPASWWLDVRDVHVPDFVSGADPTIEVDRVIYGAFFADWKVEIYTTDGALVEWCQGDGSNDYQVSDRLHKVTMFSWWMDREPCSLPAGEYVLKTSWKLHPPDFPEKQVRSTSNVFTVLE